MEKTSSELALFTLFSGFMKQFIWQEERNWIPIKSDPVLSKTRAAMQKAATYLARAEQDLNTISSATLDHKKSTQAFKDINNWVFYFTQYMKDKENTELLSSCIKKRLYGLFNIVLKSHVNQVTQQMLLGQYETHVLEYETTHSLNFNVNYKLNIATKLFLSENLDFTSLYSKVLCSHKGNHTLGENGAKELAGKIFKRFYEAEQRAYEDSGVSEFTTRNPGAVEFGEDIDSEGANYIPRQFAEVPTGEFYLAKEDEHKSNWSMSEYDYYFSSDEVVEDENGTRLVIDYEARNEKYFELRQAILRAKNIGQREKILSYSNQLVKTEIITSWMSFKLREFATACSNYKGQRENNY